MEYKGIFDTHAHYDDEKFNEDRDTVLRNIFEHGVSLVVDPACDLETCEKTLELSSKYDFVYDDSSYRPNGFSYYDDEKLVIQAKLIKKLSHFVSRNAMNIEGISDAILTKLIDKSIITKNSDLFNLEKYKQIKEKAE